MPLGLRIVALIFALGLAASGCGKGPKTQPISGVCAGKPGSYRSQIFQGPQGSRSYFLHVPPQYDCRKRWPMLVYFHGTAQDVVAPEEMLLLEEMVALADQEGFIVLRPRSRSALHHGSQLFQWDIGEGDLGLNLAFTEDLVAEVSRRYAVDPSRLYVSGFSNGSNMAAQFLTELPALFQGVGLVAGGLWSPSSFASLSNDQRRLYVATGYRDYLYDSVRTLLAALAHAGFPSKNIRQRVSDAGHDLYPWHLKELWRWLDTGTTAPAPGVLNENWKRDRTFPARKIDLLDVTQNAVGDVIISGSGGQIWLKPRGSYWRAAKGNGVGFAQNITDVCLLASGKGIAVAEGVLSRTLDHGRTWTRLLSLPDFAESDLDGAKLTGVGCSGSGRFVAAGYWSGAFSADGGEAWQRSEMLSAPDVFSQVADIEIGPTGTAIAVGFLNYLGRSTDDEFFEKIDLPVRTDWLSAVASAPLGNWWVVGDHGTIIHSSDDGVFWEDQSVEADDLYAVAFWNESLGMAVGARGTALLTQNGGVVWEDVSTGLDLVLADVLFWDEQTVVAVGEQSGVYTFPVSAAQ